MNENDYSKNLKPKDLAKDNDEFIKFLKVVGYSYDDKELDDVKYLGYNLDDHEYIYLASGYDKENDKYWASKFFVWFDKDMNLTGDWAGRPIIESSDYDKVLEKFENFVDHRLVV